MRPFGRRFPRFRVARSNLVSDLDVRDFFRGSVCHEDRVSPLKLQKKSFAAAPAAVRPAPSAMPTSAVIRPVEMALPVAANSAASTTMAAAPLTQATIAAPHTNDPRITLVARAVSARLGGSLTRLFEMQYSYVPPRPCWQSHSQFPVLILAQFIASFQVRRSDPSYIRSSRT